MMLTILKFLCRINLPFVSALIRSIPSNRRIKPWCVAHSRSLAEVKKHFIFKTNFCGIKWSTNALPDLLTRHLLFEGAYQEDVLLSIKHLSKPGSVMFDVGGHHGYMALVASSSVGENGKVITFEPNPYSQDWLNKNLALNGANNVDVKGLAVSKETGDVTLHVQKGTTTWNTSLFRDAIGEGYEVEEITVPMTTIDQFVDESGLVPSVMKIDIEGSEFLALEGAKDTVAKHRPVIIMEFNPVAAEAADVQISDIVARMENLGYELSVLKRNKLNRYSFNHREPFSEQKHCADDLCNVLCIPK